MDGTDGMREAAEGLVAGLGRAAPPPATFVPLRPPPGGAPPCIAVDGSHAVLADTGAAWAVAVRAAAVPWPGPAPAPRRPEVVAATPDGAQARLDAAYAAWGIEAPPARSAEAFADAWRSLREAEAAVEAAPRVPAGGILLVDGALSGLPSAPQALADRVRAAAAQAGVALLGVSKRSALARAGQPLAATWQRTGPPGAWAAEVEPGVHVARLHPAARHAFRVDAPDAAAVARLLPLCRDAAYAGYPYPLALAHNGVAITRPHARDLAARLLDHAVRAGGAAAAGLLADFHGVLDRNVG